MSFMLSASAATAEQLVDLNESNFQPEVRVLAALDIVEGYEDGTYRPAKDVTRAELATILARVKVGGDKEMIDTYNYGHMTYTDVLTTGHIWAAPAIQYATDNGMVVGDGNGLYRPADTVTVVEGLKMLLTALGYDAEIEGLQNVGAAWKANVLALAREVGLLNRYYGDTNKNMTRDDMALLIWNFLNSDVVKGYYENDVANVDTIMYVGGTALEIYFAKQVVYGAIVANEAANLDLYYEPNAMTENRLATGETQLFLYDNAEGLTVNEALALTGRRGPQTGDYFRTFVNLSTDLGDIGEPVFVITDLEAYKGEWYAVGGECFSTGTNTVGIETWDAVDSLFPLTTADTLYFNNYDRPAQAVATAAPAAPNTNGNFLKTVDWDGDGKLDVVLHEDWGMTQILNTTKQGVVYTCDSTPDGKINNELLTTRNLIGEVAPYSVVNIMRADGFFYVTTAEKLSGLTLAAGLDAVNFKNGYVTLSDDNQYYQSAVLFDNVAANKLTDIMDCANHPFDMTSYTWFLDNGGYIRVYGVDATVYDGLYLLTEATSVKSGRDSWNKAVDTYKQSEDMVNYVAIDFGMFVENAERPYGEALNGAIKVPGAVAEAQTNLAAGIAADPTLSIFNATSLPTVDAVIELQGKLNDWTYNTTNDYDKYGDYNVNNGGAESKIVYTTTETDYYYVTLTKDRNNVTYVKSVQYFKGYNNMPAYDFGSCEVVYAAASVQKDNTGDKYYLANTVVIETFENTTNVLAPYFAYEHVSGSKDSKTGIYNAIAPTGENTTYTITDLNAKYVDEVLGALGFYEFDANTGAATQIVDNWATYGISAHTIAVEETGLIDYYVLDNVGGQRIKVTAETPVYAVMNETVNNNTTGLVTYKYWSVTDWSEYLAEGDKIVMVEKVPGVIEYILVFDGTDDLYKGQTWAYDENGIATELYNAIATGKPLYTAQDILEVFQAAVEAYTLNKSEANYKAMIEAFTPCQAAYGWKAGQGAELEAALAGSTYEYDISFCAYYNAVTGAKIEAFETAVANAVVGNKVNVEAYYGDGNVKTAYNAFEDYELAHLSFWYGETFDAAVDAYIEVADKIVALVADLKWAVEGYDKAIENSSEVDTWLEQVKLALDAWNDIAAEYCTSYWANEANDIVNPSLS